MLSLHGAWQAERFARVEKLRSFAHYAKALTKMGGAERPQAAAQRLSTFHALAAAGAPLKITRIS